MKALTVFILVFVSACATREVKVPLPVKPLSGLKTPKLILPKDADPDMRSAERVFHAYANSDEFYQYVRKTVTELEAGNENDVERAITKYRSCLGSHAPVSIVYKNYSLKNANRVIGGWRDSYIAQNRYKELNAIDRAAHWVHELTHACGFTHIDNDIVIHPSIQRSWPYQVGNAFRDFIQDKAI
jgi:hypothetical protein